MDNVIDPFDAWRHPSGNGKATIRVKTYTPTFRGRHNEIRSKAMLVLLNHQLAGGNGLTLSDLMAAIPTANYQSLAVLLRKWSTYRRRKPIGYHVTTRGGIRVKVYRILAPGRAWLDRWIQAGELPIERYLDELDYRTLTKGG